jgi:hypothetical protein
MEDFYAAGLEGYYVGLGLTDAQQMITDYWSELLAAT